MATDIETVLREFPMFSELSKKDISRMSSLMTGVTLDAGTELTREGEMSREAILIVEGEAEVMVGDETVASVGPGDFVGELGVIAGTLRTATVTATTEIVAQVLTRSEFNTLLDEQPEIARKLLVGSVKRLVELEEVRC